MTRFMPLLLVLSACAGGRAADDDDDDDGRAYDDRYCEIEVDAVFPDDDATNAWDGTEVMFDLSEEDASATLELFDEAGDAVPGAQRTEGSVLWFTPAAPLQRGETYTAMATLCEGQREPWITFTVGDLGAPLTVEVAGEAYIVDLYRHGDRTLGTLAILLGVPDDDTFLVGLMSTDPLLRLQVAPLLPGTDTQNICRPTVELPAADFSASPAFSFGPRTSSLGRDRLEIHVADLAFSGIFSSDGSTLGAGTLSGEFDARVPPAALSERLDYGGPDALCSTVEGFGVRCEPCTSDGAPYCLRIKLFGIPGERTGSPLVPRTQADIDADEACGGTPAPGPAPSGG